VLRVNKVVYIHVLARQKLRESHQWKGMPVREVGGQSWCEQHDLLVNPTKTEMVLFTRNNFRAPRFFDKELKCSVIRFGPRHHSQCSDVTMLGNSIKFVNSTKLLVVQLTAYKKFRIDIGYMKSSFVVLLMVCFTMLLN